MLDIHTEVVMVASAFGLVAILLAVIARVHPSIPGIRLWLTGQVLGSVSMIAYVSRDLGSSLPVSVLVANGCFALGLYAILLGNLRFTGRALPRTHLGFLVPYVGFLGVMGYFATVSVSYVTRSVIASVVFAVLSVGCALALRPLLRCRRHHIGGRILTWTFLGHGVFHAIRAGLSPTPMNGSVFLTDNLLSEITFGVELVFTLLTLGGFVALIGERLQHQLWDLADHDALTGLLNRRAFQLLAENQLEMAHREQRGLGVFMLDLDHFKDVNDAHGHLVGDSVLREVAARLEEGRRRHDLVGRFGGDEFILQFYDIDLPTATRVGEELREAISSTSHATGDDPVGVTVSIGIAVGTGSALERVEDLIRHADRALYEAKALGRNAVVTTSLSATPLA